MGSIECTDHRQQRSWPRPGVSLVAFVHSSASNFYHSDYPYTTVPNQVHRIFRAQQLHDKKHFDERMSVTPEQRKNIPYIDYLRPIIADADTGLVTLNYVSYLQIIIKSVAMAGFLPCSSW